MRTLAYWSLIALYASATNGAIRVAAQTLSGHASKSNLDLPFSAGRFDDDTVDDDEVDVITFYSQQFEGDGIFYAIDRSGTMQNSGELNIAKREVIKNIVEFSGRVEFAIVFFDRGIVRFPAGGRATKASAAMKAAAVNWVESIPGGGGSCCQQGLLGALKYANTSAARRRILVYVGDGGGTCNGASEQDYLAQTLGVVRSQNVQRAQINAIGVLDVGTIQEAFLRSLASQNGGRYVRVQ